MSAALAALWLLAAPCVELRAADVVLTDAARLRVVLRSTDGQPHRVRLEAGSESGLRLQPGASIALPATEPVSVERLLFRGTAPWGSQHELRLVALEESAGSASEPARLAGALGIRAQVRPDPAWLKRLRLPMAVAGAALLLAAVAYELYRALRRV